MTAPAPVTARCTVGGINWEYTRTHGWQAADDVYWPVPRRASAEQRLAAELYLGIAPQRASASDV